MNQYDLLIISCSLNKNSKSRVLAHFIENEAIARSIRARLIDLQSTPLPFCDGDLAYENPSVIELQKSVQESKALLIATPIYNYTVSATAKNFIELMGKNLQNKTIGVTCTVGSPTSYLAPGNFLLSCLFDFQCHIVPKVVFADATHFAENGDLKDQKIKERLRSLLASTKKLGDLHYQHHLEG